MDRAHGCHHATSQDSFASVTARDRRAGLKPHAQGTHSPWPPTKAPSPETSPRLGKSAQRHLSAVQRHRCAAVRFFIGTVGWAVPSSRPTACCCGSSKASSAWSHRHRHPGDHQLYLQRKRDAAGSADKPISSLGQRRWQPAYGAPGDSRDHPFLPLTGGPARGLALPNLSPTCFDSPDPSRVARSPMSSPIRPVSSHLAVVPLLSPCASPHASRCSGALCSSRPVALLSTPDDADRLAASRQALTSCRGAPYPIVLAHGFAGLSASAHLTTSSWSQPICAAAARRSSKRRSRRLTARPCADLPCHRHR